VIKHKDYKFENRPTTLPTLWGEIADRRLSFHVLLACLCCTVFGLTGIFIDISKGFYVIKLSLMFIFATFIFSRKHYSFLIGLLIPCYFVLKAPGSLPYDKALMLSYSHIMVIFMAISLMLVMPIKVGGKYKSRFDVVTSLLIFLFVVVFLGMFFIENWYLFMRRLIEILGFVCAYILGRNYNVFLHSEARLLLLGLGFSLFAFTMPWTVGLVVREGFSVLDSLNTRLNDVGAQSSAVEAGIALLIFAFSYALFIVSNDSKTKMQALYGVAIPAAFVGMFFLSKAAILLMLVIVAYMLVATQLIESLKNRRLKTWVIIITMFTLFITVLIVYLPGLLDSFTNRWLTVDKTATGRLDVWKLALNVGMENIVLGVGSGQFRLDTGIWHAHNDLLTVFSENGLVAFLSYFLVFILLGCTIFHLFRMKKEFRVLAILYGAVFVAYIGYSQVEPMIFSRAGLLFMFLSGWLVTGYKWRYLYQNSKTTEVNANRVTLKKNN